MKKYLVLTLALVCAFGITATVCADNERPITVDQLPAPAQTLIKQHFPNSKVTIAQEELALIGKGYDVMFTNGDKLEFDRKGNWTEITCRTSQVPTDLIPSAIATYVSANYSDAKVISIERDSRDYEVNLSNGLEITFNKKFQVVDIDD